MKCFVFNLDIELCTAFLYINYITQGLDDIRAITGSPSSVQILRAHKADLVENITAHNSVHG